MKRLILPGFVITLLLSSVLLSLGCSGDKADGGGGSTVSPTWISVREEGDTVSLPTSELTSGKQLHFKLGAQNFMAYQLEGETYVRANVCPPCRSIGFSRKGNVLVCNTCGTTFDAGSGDGISGACVDYPKASVTTATSGDDTTMSKADLLDAYSETLRKG